MSKSTEKLEWSNIDTTALPGTLATEWKKLKEAQAHAKSIREAFEEKLVAAMNAQNIVPAGQVPMFSYRFGGAAVAFVTKAGPRAKASVISLAGGKARR